VSVQQCHRRHWIGDETPPQRIKTVGEESRIFDGIFKVEAVGIELGDGGSGDDHTAREAMLDNVQRQEKRLVESWNETIIWRTRE